MSEDHGLPAMLLRTLQQERNNANEISKRITQSSYTDDLEYAGIDFGGKNKGYNVCCAQNIYYIKCYTPYFIMVTNIL